MLTALARVLGKGQNDILECLGMPTHKSVLLICPRLPYQGEQLRALAGSGVNGKYYREQFDYLAPSVILTEPTITVHSGRVVS